MAIEITAKHPQMSNTAGRVESLPLSLYALIKLR